MADLKTCAKNNEEQEGKFGIVKCSSNDLRMEFSFNRCATVFFRKRQSNKCLKGLGLGGYRYPRRKLGRHIQIS